MRIGFVTCVQLGLSCMEAIYAIGGRLSLVLTLPDERAALKSGRVFLDGFCAQHHVPLVKVSHINDPEAIQAIRAANVDWLFIIGWSQIASSELLEAPSCGVLGMHPTLLPVGRGRAAIPWAILSRLPETGVTLFRLDEGVDSGPIAGQLRIPLGPATNATWLYEQITSAHVKLMLEFFPKLMDGGILWRAQDETLATTWPGRSPDDGRINVQASVWEAERLVRATTRPYPGAFLDRPDGKLIVWDARVHDSGTCASLVHFQDGALEILESEFVPAFRGEL